MPRQLLALGSCLVLVGAGAVLAPLSAQAPAGRAVAPAQAGAKAGTMPRTPDGKPDLQGNWSNATVTPLERPAGQPAVLSPALGIGAFAEKTLVAAGQCTKVAPSDPAVVGLLGCGVMAGFGAAVNTGGVGLGDSIAVIGCGGVGNAAIAGAKVVGATTIIAVDVDDRKLQWAKEFGATHTINSTSEDAVEKIRELTGSYGADVVVEAVGRPETYQQAFFARDLAGTVVLVGVPTPDLKLELPLIEIFGRGGSLKSSWYGDCLPTRDFPTLVSLYQQGRFPLDAFVSERIGLGDIESAFDKMHKGEVLRSVVEL